MGIGAAEEAGIGEEKAGGVFLLGHGFEGGAMASRRVCRRVQARGSGAQESAQHCEGPRGIPAVGKVLRRVKEYIEGKYQVKV